VSFLDHLDLVGNNVLEFSLDKEEIEISCPKCGFFNYVFFKQIKLNNVIICRGCKINLRLDDYLGECASAERKIKRELRDLENSLKGFSVTLKL